MVFNLTTTFTHSLPAAFSQIPSTPTQPSEILLNHPSKNTFMIYDQKKTVSVIDIIGHWALAPARFLMGEKQVILFPSGEMQIQAQASVWSREDWHSPKTWIKTTLAIILFIPMTLVGICCRNRLVASENMQKQFHGYQAYILFTEWKASLGTSAAFKLEDHPQINPQNRLILATWLIQEIKANNTPEAPAALKNILPKPYEYEDLHLLEPYVYEKNYKKSLSMEARTDTQGGPIHYFDNSSLQHVIFIRELMAIHDTDPQLAEEFVQALAQDEKDGPVKLLKMLYVTFHHADYSGLEGLTDVKTRYPSFYQLLNGVVQTLTVEQKKSFEIHYTQIFLPSRLAFQKKMAVAENLHNYFHLSVDNLKPLEDFEGEELYTFLKDIPSFSTIGLKDGIFYIELNESETLYLSDRQVVSVLKKLIQHTYCSPLTDFPTLIIDELTTNENLAKALFTKLDAKTKWYFLGCINLETREAWGLTKFLEENETLPLKTWFDMIIDPYARGGHAKLIHEFIPNDVFREAVKDRRMRNTLVHSSEKNLPFLLRLIPCLTLGNIIKIFEHGRWSQILFILDNIHHADLQEIPAEEIRTWVKASAISILERQSLSVSDSKSGWQAYIEIIQRRELYSAFRDIKEYVLEKVGDVEVPSIKNYLAWCERKMACKTKRSSNENKILNHYFQFLHTAFTYNEQTRSQMFILFTRKEKVLLQEYFAKESIKLVILSLEGLCLHNLHKVRDLNLEKITAVELKEKAKFNVQPEEVTSNKVPRYEGFSYRERA